MRPAPSISRSNLSARAVSPGMASSGRFSRTGTLTSTWGNLVRHAASAESDLPVSRITVSSWSAEMIPSPVVA